MAEERNIRYADVLTLYEWGLKIWQFHLDIVQALEREWNIKS